MAKGWTKIFEPEKNLITRAISVEIVGPTAQGRRRAVPER